MTIVPYGRSQGYFEGKSDRFWSLSYSSSVRHSEKLVEPGRNQRTKEETSITRPVWHHIVRSVYIREKAALTTIRNSPRSDRNLDDDDVFVEGGEVLK